MVIGMKEAIMEIQMREVTMVMEIRGTIMEMETLEVITVMGILVAIMVMGIQEVIMVMGILVAIMAMGILETIMEMGALLEIAITKLNFVVPPGCRLCVLGAMQVDGALAGRKAPVQSVLNNGSTKELHY